MSGAYGERCMRRLPNAAWAWEGLRRNDEYARNWRAARVGLPVAQRLRTGAVLLRARRRFPVAERWGLVQFADPSKTAMDGGVFWSPKLLSGVLHVQLSSLASDGPKAFSGHDIIALSALKSRRILLETVDGARHILLGGDRFWIQLYCETPFSIGDQARIGIRIDGATHAQRRLDTAAQLLSLHRSAGGKLSLIGRRKNAKPLANAILAYDIWRGWNRPQGGLKDIAEAIVGRERVSEDWGGASRYLKDMARRARDKGEAFVGGGYRDLLLKKSI